MIQLRPYQNKFVSDIRESIKINKRIIACAATGSGKSKVFISIARGCIEHKRTVLIISESTSIYRQIHTEIVDTVNIGEGIKEFYLVSKQLVLVPLTTLTPLQYQVIKQTMEMCSKDLLLI